MVAAGALTSALFDIEPLPASDAEELIELLSDASLYTFTGGGPPSLGELRDRHTRLVAGDPTGTSEWMNWIIRTRDGVAVGALQAEVTGDVATLAWTVGTLYQRQRIATEATAALINWLTAVGITDLRAHIHPDHSPSIGVARRLGFTATSDRDDGEVVWHLETGSVGVSIPAELSPYVHDGKLRVLPAERAARLALFDWLAQRFEPGHRYTEAQVNDALRPVSEDTASLRRYLVDEGFLDRRAGAYWRSGGTVND